MKISNFAIIGIGGYIAPRHLHAINETGNSIVCATDVNDSVGILDCYTKDVEFFTDFERFQEYMESLKGTDREVHFVSICSPNYLHTPHMKFALSQGCDVICEKPLVLNEFQIDEIKEYERKFGKKVYTILQLRVHDSIIALKEKVEKENKSEKHEIILTYLTSRGPWYHESWKGNLNKSGGLSSNIGVHFFDMLTWIFGDVEKNEIHKKNDYMASGYLELEKAKVKWFLSVDKNYLPQEAIDKEMTTYRSITVDGNEVEFSGGFTDLHSKLYENAINGQGFGVEDNRKAIRIVEQIRDSKELGVQDNSHDLLKGL